MSFLNFVFSQFVSVMVLLSTGSLISSSSAIFGICCASLIFETVVNTFPIKILGKIQVFGFFWMMLVSFLIIIGLPSISLKHQPLTYVFTAVNDNSSSTGLNSRPYLFALGILMSQRALLGFESSGYLAEETKQAEWNVPLGMTLSTVVSVIVGILLIFSITIR